MARWEFVLTNKTGGSVGAFDAPHDIKYTRRASAACELELSIYDTYDLNIVQAAPHTRKIKAFRDGVLRFHGDVVEPFVVTQEGMAIQAKDAFGRLARPARTTHDFTDGEQFDAMFEQVLDDEGTYSTNDFVYGSETPDEIFYRKLKAGQRIDEFFMNMCSSNPYSGVWFRLDAEPGPDNTTVIHYYNALTREDNNAAHFEYGPNTLGNVADFEVEHRGLVNRVTIYGKSVTVTVEDEESIDEYGLVAKSFRRPGVSDTETAYGIAYSKLAPTPYTLSAFTPTPSAPKLFDDFDVGDLCRTYFESGNMVYQADDMIPETVELTIDSSGNEYIGFGDDIVTGKADPRKLNVVASSSARYTKPRRHSTRKSRIESAVRYTMDRKDEPEPGKHRPPKRPRGGAGKFSAYTVESFAHGAPTEQLVIQDADVHFANGWRLMGSGWGMAQGAFLGGGQMHFAVQEGTAPFDPIDGGDPSTFGNSFAHFDLETGQGPRHVGWFKFPTLEAGPDVMFNVYGENLGGASDVTHGKSEIQFAWYKP